MAEVFDNTPQEFWRPPAVQAESAPPALAGACDRCGSEFMVGARFCYVCGASRLPKDVASAVSPWARSLELLRMLEFQNLQDWLGLSTAPLIAFLIGASCVLAALLVGLIFSVQSLADFQAIQSWRIEWLLGALVAFV